MLDAPRHKGWDGNGTCKSRTPVVVDVCALSHDTNTLTHTSAAKEWTKHRRRAPSSFPGIHASQPSGSRNEVSFESVLIGNIGKTRLGTIVGMFGTPKVNALPLQSVHSFWLNGGAKATASNMWRPSPTILALAKPKMKHGMAKHAL